MMKKKYNIMGLILLTLTLLVFIGCSGCEHESENWTIIKEATCTSKGLKIGYCKICEEDVEVKIDKIEHEYDGLYANKKGHYNVCNICNEKSDVDRHKKSKEDEYGKQHCEICGYRIKAEEGIVNDLKSGDWSFELNDVTIFTYSVNDYEVVESGMEDIINIDKLYFNYDNEGNIIGYGKGEIKLIDIIANVRNEEKIVSGEIVIKGYNCYLSGYYKEFDELTTITTSGKKEFLYSGKIDQILTSDDINTNQIFITREESSNEVVNQLYDSFENFDESFKDVLNSKLFKKTSSNDKYEKSYQYSINYDYIKEVNDIFYNYCISEALDELHGKGKFKDLSEEINQLLKDDFQTVIEKIEKEEDIDIEEFLETLDEAVFESTNGSYEDFEIYFGLEYRFEDLINENNSFAKTLQIILNDTDTSEEEFIKKINNKITEIGEKNLYQYLAEELGLSDSKVTLKKKINEIIEELEKSINMKITYNDSDIIKEIELIFNNNKNNISGTKGSCVISFQKNNENIDKIIDKIESVTNKVVIDDKAEYVPYTELTTNINNKPNVSYETKVDYRKNANGEVTNILISVSKVTTSKNNTSDNTYQIYTTTNKKMYNLEMGKEILGVRLTKDCNGWYYVSMYAEGIPTDIMRKEYVENYADDKLVNGEEKYYNFSIDITKELNFYYNVEKKQFTIGIILPETLHEWDLISSNDEFSTGCNEKLIYEYCCKKCNEIETIERNNLHSTKVFAKAEFTGYINDCTKGVLITEKCSKCDEIIKQTEEDYHYDVKMLYFEFSKCENYGLNYYPHALYLQTCPCGENYHHVITHGMHFTKTETIDGIEYFYRYCKDCSNDAYVKFYYEYNDKTTIHLECYENNKLLKTFEYTYSKN